MSWTVIVPDEQRAFDRGVESLSAENHRELSRVGTPADPTIPILTLCGDADDWAQLAPGVKARTLPADRGLGRTTLVIKMDAGADYPDQHHHGLEERHVIEGTLNIAGTMLKKGDYQRCLGGTDHGPSFSTTGCLLLINVPLADAA